MLHDHVFDEFLNASPRKHGLLTTFALLSWSDDSGHLESECISLLLLLFFVLGPSAFRTKILDFLANID